jgi:hypothetical protein
MEVVLGEDDSVSFLEIECSFMVLKPLVIPRIPYILACRIALKLTKD